MEQHYVGSNFVTSPAKMPGFDYWETNRLDQVGRFNDCVLFLTFDDWGNDESINKLLYVLKKHHVKATFFVLTENVDKNPNTCCGQSRLTAMKSPATLTLTCPWRPVKRVPTII